MTNVHPFIGFKNKKDRDRFKKRVFSEYKKRKPKIVDSDLLKERLLSDKEIRQYLNIHNVKYGYGETFNMLSDIIKMPKLYWLSFCGYWELLETLEKILKREYNEYVYLVTN